MLTIWTVYVHKKKGLINTEIFQDYTIVENRYDRNNKKLS